MVDSKTLEEKMMGFFSLTYRKDIKELSKETRIHEDLSPKSLLLIGLVAQIESEFDIQFPFTEAGKAKTIGEMIERVAALLK